MATVHLNAIRLNGIVGADRKLTVQLPLDVPDGPVELVVLLPEKPESPAEASENEGSSARAQKLAELQMRVKMAGQEGTIRFPNPHATPSPLSDTELLELGKLPLDARPSHELISEDREDRF